MSRASPHGPSGRLPLGGRSRFSLPCASPPGSSSHGAAMKRTPRSPSARPGWLSGPGRKAILNPDATLSRRLSYICVESENEADTPTAERSLGPPLSPSFEREFHHTHRLPFNPFPWRGCSGLRPRPEQPPSCFPFPGPGPPPLAFPADPGTMRAGLLEGKSV